MAALELHDTDGPVLRENINKAIDGLELPHQKVQVQHNVVWLSVRWLSVTLQNSSSSDDNYTLKHLTSYYSSSF